MLTGHQRLHILRAINADARPDFRDIHLNVEGGCTMAYWPVAHIGAGVTFFLDLDDQRAWHPRIEFDDGTIIRSRRDDTLGAAITERLRPIWLDVFEQLKLAADREQRVWAAEYEQRLEWAALDAEVYETHLEMRAADGPF